MTDIQLKNIRFILLLAAIIYWVIGGYFLLSGTVSPITIDADGGTKEVYLSDILEYPRPIITWIVIILIPIVLGIIAWWHRRKRADELTKKTGITLIVIGLLTFFTGAGIILAMAGGQMVIVRNRFG